MARNERFLIAIVIIISFIIGGLMGYILDTQVLQKFPEKDMEIQVPNDICGCVFLHEYKPAMDSIIRKMPSSPNAELCYFQ